MFDSINNDIIYVDCNRYSRNRENKIEDIINHYTRYCYWYNRVSQAIFSLSPDDVKTYIDSINKNTVGSKLYFDPSSKFPRTKISDNYKRVIKEEKSDTVIINNICSNVNDYVSEVVIYQLDNLYIVFYGQKNMKRDEPFLKSMVYNVFEHNFPSAKRLGITKLYYGDKKIVNMIKAIKKYDLSKIVFDSKLDNEISNKSESLDIDAIDSIVNMLKSTDLSICAIGLKVLAGYNYRECRNTVYYILALFADNYRNCPELKSTLVSNMITSIGINVSRFYGFNKLSRDCQSFMTQSNLGQFSDLDKELFIYVSRDLIRQVSMWQTERLNSFVNNELNINVSINVSTE